MAEQRRYLIEFCGGDWDGKILDSQSEDEQERHRADGCLFMTENGTVGRAFHGRSMVMGEMLARGEISYKDLDAARGPRKGPRPMHRYTVTDRKQEGNVTRIKITYDVELPEWLPLKSTAHVLEMTEQDVLNMEAQGKIGTRMWKTMKLYHLDYDEKRTPVFLSVPPS